MKELEMLRAILGERPCEHVTLHLTTSGQIVLNRFNGPSPSQANTLEGVISDYHARLMGFKSASILHEKFTK